MFNMIVKISFQFVFNLGGAFNKVVGEISISAFAYYQVSIETRP